MEVKLRTICWVEDGEGLRLSERMRERSSKRDEVVVSR